MEQKESEDVNQSFNVYKFDCSHITLVTLLLRSATQVP